MFDDLMGDDHMSDGEIISIEHSDYGHPVPAASSISSEAIQLPSRIRSINCHLDMSRMPKDHAPGTQGGAVIVKLEDMLEVILDCLLEDQPLVIRLKSRHNNFPQVLDPINGILKKTGTVKTKEIRFPGKTQREAWKFGKRGS